MTTTDSMLPPPAPPPGPDDDAVILAAGRRERRRWTVVIVLVVLGLVGYASFRYEFPYYALAPGSVRSTEERIEIAGGQSFESDGVIDFTTVSVRGRLTIWGMLGYWLDADSKVVEEKVVLGDRTPRQRQEENRQMMVDSKDRALAVAFTMLGYDVFEGTGALVTDVASDAPAAGKLGVDDVITEVNGQPVEISGEVVDVIRGSAPGEAIELTVEGVDGATRTERVVLGERPDDETAGYLGVGLTTNDLEFDYPFDVTIDTGSVGGPSAGLAFTLGIIDELTPGELTGGEEVAVTGTIDLDGTVGLIGGVEQKAAAVRDAGIDTFLVPYGLPPEELEAAKERVGDKVDIIEVKTLDDALDALARLGGNAGELPSYEDAAG